MISIYLFRAFIQTSKSCLSLWFNISLHFNLFLVHLASISFVHVESSTIEIVDYMRTHITFDASIKALFVENWTEVSLSFSTNKYDLGLVFYVLSYKSIIRLCWGFDYECLGREKC